MEIVKVFPILITGFFLGVQHAMDTDHLVAVSTMVSRSKSLKRSAILGILWGSGHTATLLLMGFLILSLRLTIPNTLENFFEYLIGFLLIFLGATVILNLKRKKIHIHNHDHGSDQHIHIHNHKQSTHHHHEHRSFYVGIAHGLAGSATLMLVVLSTISSLGLGLIYIIFFGVGSILGMLLFASLLYLPFQATAKAFPALNRGIALIIGLISIFFGLTILF